MIVLAVGEKTLVGDAHRALECFFVLEPLTLKLTLAAELQSGQRHSRSRSRRACRKCGDRRFITDFLWIGLPIFPSCVVDPVFTSVYPGTTAQSWF